MSHLYEVQYLPRMAVPTNRLRVTLVNVVNLCNKQKSKWYSTNLSDTHVI